MTPTPFDRSDLPRAAPILILITLLLSLLFVAVTGAGQQARWHRYAQTRLDDKTTIDVVKDVYSQQCYAVYVRHRSNGAATGSTVAPLGPVPCEPVVGR